MSTSTQSQDEKIICSINAQRTRFLSLLTPQNRYTPVSPYPKYSKAQLDMRRKTEVLKYEKNSTQASSLTKSQKWSQLVTNNGRTPVCYKNPYLPTPTSACGVPGPLVFLSYDPNVPLYNYSSSKDVYANYTETTYIPWTTALNTIKPIAVNSIESNLFTLAIQDAPNPSYTFRFTAPIGIYVSGNNTSTQDVTGNISITGLTLNIYYYTGTLDSTNTPTYTRNITSIYTPIFSNSTTFTTNNIASSSPTNYFEAIQYVGNISVPNVPLTTTYGYIYDFNLKFNLQNNTTSGNLGKISNLSYGAYLNAPNLSALKNCTVVPQSNATVSSYQPFSFGGV